MSESSVGIAGALMAMAIFLWRSGIIQILFEKWLNNRKAGPSGLTPGRAVERLRRLLDERRKLRNRKKEGESRLDLLDKEIVELRKFILEDDKEDEV
jgi:hypothetical protein